MDAVEVVFTIATYIHPDSQDAYSVLDGSDRASALHYIMSIL